MRDKKKIIPSGCTGRRRVGTRLLTMCLSREPVSVAWWIVCVSGDGNGGGV